MEEIWKPAKYIKFDGTVIDFTGLYEVSNLSNVKSIKRTKSNRYRQIPVKEIILTQHLNKSNYYVADLYVGNNIKINCQVNRLVLSSFDSDGWFEGAEANHKDECTTNNVFDNLEWLSSKDNNNYGNRISKSVSKLKNGKCSKTIIQYDLEDNLINEWPSMAEINRQLGYSQASICNNCKGNTKQAYGYIWKYKEGA